MNKNFWIIEIFKKKNILDIFGKEIKKSINELGIFGIEEVKVSNLYKVEGNIKRKTIERIVKNLLIDKISEDFKIYKKTKRRRDYWIVEIFLKEGVTDPVGDTAKKTIIESGILKNVTVKTGKKYYIEGEFTEEIIKEICEKILANSLIQNYFIYKKIEK